MIQSKLTDAIVNVDDALKAVKSGAPISDETIRTLQTLANQARCLRDQMVLADLAKGILGKTVALKYNLTPIKVSRIKNGEKQE